MRNGLADHVRIHLAELRHRGDRGENRTEPCAVWSRGNSCTEPCASGRGARRRALLQIRVDRVWARVLTPATVERYFGEWAGMRVVLEAGCHSNRVYRLLKRLKHEPLMADTHRPALITQSLSKDDRRRRY